MRCIHAAILCVAAVVVSQAAAAETLRILYEDRPPYYVTHADGTVGGIVGGPVGEALHDAHIVHEWVIMPSSRQLFTIRHNDAYACSPGWFRNDERETFAKFSDVVYRDRPQVVAARSSDENLFNDRSLKDILADTRLILGVKTGFSYGETIDGLIAANAPVMVATTQSMEGMRRMLTRRRFDYFIVAPEEFETLAAAALGDGATIVSIAHADIPPGNARYLMCALQVPDDILQRFNVALARVIEQDGPQP